MNLNVEIEHKVRDNFALCKSAPCKFAPSLKDMGLMQIRHNGVYINGELHLWENIKRVIITNEEV